MDGAPIGLAKIGCYFDEIVLILNSTNKVQYCNKAAKNYFDRSDNEIYHQDFFSYCQKKEFQIPPCLEKINNCTESNEISGQTTSTNRNNQKITIDWKAIKLSLSSGEFSVVLIGKDISDEFQKNEKIEDLESQLNTIIELMSGNYWLKDVHGVYRGFNQALLTLLGVKHEEVIGKTDYDLPWADTADILVANDQQVMTSGKLCKTEEEIKSASGEIRLFEILKIPLKNSKGEVIGTIGNSIDITERKQTELKAQKAIEEATQLKVENAEHKVQLEANAQFAKLANQVVHDIRSPLSSLMIIVKHCHDLPETERIALREAARGIGDIANNLLNQYQVEKNEATIHHEERKPVLLSATILQLLTDKRFQYKELSVQFEDQISRAGQFAFVQIQLSAFKRMISNLINNAVDAFENKAGVVIVKLDASDELVKVIVADNGKGMPPHIVDKIMQNVAFTAGKSDGHGIGLTQVRDTLQANEGKMSIQSTPGKGTQIILEFPHIQTPDWIAKEIRLGKNDRVIILDDDSSIHGAWDTRFEPITKQAPNITVKHFEICHDALDHIRQFTEDEKQKIYLLTDYELLKQELNGLNVVERSGIKRSILVTSHYNDPIVLDLAGKTGTKILPKQLAPEISIIVDESIKSDSDAQAQSENLALKKVDAILVDDDKRFADSLMRYVFGNNKIDHFEDPNEFMERIKNYPKETRIYLDNNYKSAGVTGFTLAKELHEQGYTRLYLLTGDTFQPGTTPDYIKVIRKDDIDQIKDWGDS